MQPTFIHLRVHSEYSLVDGLVRVDELVARTRELGMPAVAVTDQGNLFAMVKFYKMAREAGIKSIIGADLMLAADKPGQPASRCTLLCVNEQGYRNLTRLISRSYLEGQALGVPQIRQGWLHDHTDGLIALSGAHEGEVGRLLLARKSDEALASARVWAQLFPGRFYLELQRLGRVEDEAHVEAAVELALNLDLPVVATGDVRFLREDEFDAHEVRVCIHDGFVLNDPRRPKRNTTEQYLCSPEVMAQRFADLPEALANSVHIAERCTVDFVLGKNFLPDFPVPEGFDAASYLHATANAGLKQRLAELSGRAGKSLAPEPYQQRLQRELDVIVKMGFSGYFLIVSDFIRWARENGVPVGPGRGSGAGSLVAYVIGITDLDPLAYDLLFERFLNPERVSMPDFDIDFCMEGRDRVIEYVAERYGQSRVSQIITYGSMAARAVVRDVGRVLGHPYGMVDRIAKLIPSGPQNLDITLAKALEQSAEFRAEYEREEEIKYLIDTAMRLEGLARNAGKHAGGVVIAPRDLTDFTPIYCEPGGAHPVTQFDKDDVEAVGLVKFDFLGLRTLTIVDRAVRLVNARLPADKSPLDIRQIALDDKPTYALYSSGKTAAVFQMESGGMQRASVDLKPDNFDDIIALISLYRPGPMELIPDYVKRKHGRAKPDYLHPSLEPVLKPTYGIIVYQEQVMQIAQVLSGYTLGGADLLRRAMGKKKPEEMAKQRAIFVTGAAERQVPAEQANAIYDHIEKFAGYGFNKSHAAAYALVSYQTAWLKTHYTAEFMCAVLSADMAHTDKVVGMIEECRRLKLQVLPPDINASGWDFSVADARTIRYGLGAIKGVGEAAISAVIGERLSGGVFTDLLDFCRRIDLRKLNRRVLEALIMAGALDPLGPNRATLLHRLDDAILAAEQQGAAAAAGQSDMFGMVAEASSPASSESPALPEWPAARRLSAEKDTLGLYLTGHPIETFLPELSQLVTGRLGDLGSGAAAGNGVGNGGGSHHGYSAAQQVLVAGLLVDVKRFGARTLATLDDQSGRMECLMFEQASNKYAALLQKDALCLIQGRLAYDDYSGGYRITVNEVFDLDEARRRHARRLLLTPERPISPEQLERCLSGHRTNDGCTISLCHQRSDARGWIQLGEAWRVRPSTRLLEELQSLLGAQSVKLLYSRSNPSTSLAA